MSRNKLHNRAALVVVIRAEYVNGLRICPVEVTQTIKDRVQQTVIQVAAIQALQTLEEAVQLHILGDGPIVFLVLNMALPVVKQDRPSGVNREHVVRVRLHDTHNRAALVVVIRKGYVNGLRICHVKRIQIRAIPLLLVLHRDVIVAIILKHDTHVKMGMEC